MLPIPASSLDGDIEFVRCAGEGVDIGEAWLEFEGSPSERATWLGVILAVPVGPRAKASRVAAAASSIVPVWWFWCLVNVVRRVKVFWQSA
jgi:hypothetical protein